VTQAFCRLRLGTQLGCVTGARARVLAFPSTLYGPFAATLHSSLREDFTEWSGNRCRTHRGQLCRKREKGGRLRGAQCKLAPYLGQDGPRLH
jgi:hypothetical protein